MRGLHSLWPILLAVGLIGTPRLAPAQLSESPLTPGFWSFANRKSETTQDVRAACRNYIEIRFFRWSLHRLTNLQNRIWRCCARSWGGRSLHIQSGNAD